MFELLGKLPVFNIANMVYMRMLKLVCESLQTMYSLHFLSVESFYYWSVYGVFEQHFADVLDSPFLLEAARMYYCVPARRSGTEITYQTV